MRHKKLIVLFEGPDMTGKTTVLNDVYESLNYVKSEITGTVNSVNIANKFKFPVYDGIFGNNILNHLKTFKLSDDRLNNIESIVNFSNWQMANKITSFPKFISKIAERDIILVDRFTLSQIVYDKAWLGVLGDSIDLEEIEEKTELRRLFYNNYTITNDTFKEIIKENKDCTYKIICFIFDKSECISTLSNNKCPSGERRIDNYDTNDKYKEEVSKEFKNLFKGEILNYIPAENIYNINYDLIYMDLIISQDFSFTFGIDKTDSAFKYVNDTTKFLEIIKEKLSDKEFLKENADTIDLLRNGSRTKVKKEIIDIISQQFKTFDGWIE